MKICKVCQTRYDDRVEFCFRDGTPLGPVVDEAPSWSVEADVSADAAEEEPAAPEPAEPAEVVSAPSADVEPAGPAPTPAPTPAPPEPAQPPPPIQSSVPSPRARPARRTAAFSDLGLEAPEPASILADAPMAPLGAVTPPVSAPVSAPPTAASPTSVEIEATGDVPAFSDDAPDGLTADPIAEPSVGEDGSDWDPFEGMTTDDLDGDNAPVDLESALGTLDEEALDAPQLPPAQPKSLFYAMGALAVLCVWIGFKAIPSDTTPPTETVATEVTPVVAEPEVEPPADGDAVAAADNAEGENADNAEGEDADNAEGEDADNAEGEDADNAEGEDADNAEGEDADEEDADEEDADEEDADEEDADEEEPEESSDDRDVASDDDEDQPPEPPPLPRASGQDPSFAVAEDGEVDLWGAAETAVQQGKLRIESIPENARVFIDGKVVGRTGYTTRLEFGQYTVRVELDGYKTESRVVIVGTEEGVHVPIELKRRERVARVTVTAPVGSRIIVDNDAKEHAAPAFISLTEGLHSFRVSTPDGSFILQREVEIDDKGRAQPIALDSPGG